MKFAQFIELEETLAENGHTIDDLKESIKKGNNKLLEFFGINTALISWGVTDHMNKGLKKRMSGFKKDAGETIKSSIQKLVMAKLKASRTSNKSPEVKAEIKEIETRIIKIVNETIDKLGELKTQEIYGKIDDNSKLKDGAKLGLKYYWIKMMGDTKATLFSKLIEEKVIEDGQLRKILELDVKRDQQKLKAQAKKVNNKNSSSPSGSSKSSSGGNTSSPSGSSKSSSGGNPSSSSGSSKSSSSGSTKKNTGSKIGKSFKAPKAKAPGVKGGTI